ncbi:MAG: CDP-alcohol phosphatidyltransferase family protein [Planctomycetaceae bacterium]|nr:CDP-alcohol phosphatidyltransferase family protein [Planctomycetaceae bacterium]
MTPDAWEQFSTRCQKPDHRTVGNWYARRISRPLALHVTHIVLSTGISAHAITALAWLAGLAGVGALACGGVGGWLTAAALLQLSYLLDHVDGQVARYRDTASLDGVALDYLMHHTLTLLVPIGVGHGLLVNTGALVGLWLGIAWGVAALVQSIEHDVRCKAIVSRLKRMHGELRVIGGRGGRPTPAAPWPRAPLRVLARVVRLAGQWHVVLNSVTLLAGAMFVLADSTTLAAVYLGVMAPTSVVLALLGVMRGLQHQAAEREFAAWYEPPLGHTLRTDAGWWYVESLAEDEQHQPLTTKHSSPTLAARVHLDPAQR